MRHLIDILKRLIRWVKTPPRRDMPPAAVSKLMGEVGRTQDVEYACDEVHSLLDQFAELILRGQEAARLMPLVQLHLDLCPDCREEFEALMRILRASPA